MLIPLLNLYCLVKIRGAVAEKYGIEVRVRSKQIHSQFDLDTFSKILGGQLFYNFT